MSRFISPHDLDLIRKCLEDQRMFGLNNAETLRLVEQRLGRSIGERQLKRYKQQHLNDNEVKTWITTFVKAGFLDNYRQCIEEMIYVKNHLMRRFLYEVSKSSEEQSSGMINSLARGIREHELVMNSFNVGSPILLQVKEMIDRGLQDELNNQRSYITNKESRKDSRESRDTSEYRF
jgi:hypothetical protein